MRRTFIYALAALVLCLGTCFAALYIICDSVDEMTARCRLAQRAAEAGDADEARRLLKSADALWESRRNLMEIIVSHGALNRVSDACAEAEICLKNGDLSGFDQMLTLTLRALDEVARRERISAGNVF
jgi:hypothetical protein